MEAILQKGNQVTSGTIPVTDRWEIEGAIDEQEEEYGSQQVNDHIHQMVSGDIQTSQVVVERKTQGDHRPIEGLLDPLPPHHG
ncbi:MAG: hypothetical protein JRH06_17905 [Deltaproteobacteria bacterium]|nr:hypothetical protein [Deltaproteobacteria bacterium]